jgi:hypothetical protein
MNCRVKYQGHKGKWEVLNMTPETLDFQKEISPFKECLVCNVTTQETFTVKLKEVERIK